MQSVSHALETAFILEPAVGVAHAGFYGVEPTSVVHFPATAWKPGVLNVLPTNAGVTSSQSIWHSLVTALIL
jgi:hypothetical protein